MALYTQKHKGYRLLKGSRWGILVLGVMGLMGCSLTRNLPEGEVLYTGQKTIIADRTHTKIGQIAEAEVSAALDKEPSTKMFGILPIPFKMWMYTGFVNYEKGVGKWIFNRFAANPPVFISTVNPKVRAKVATNLLHDYGYFNGEVDYELVPDRKDSLKASLIYRVKMNTPYVIDTVYYHHFNTQTARLLDRGRRFSYLTAKRQFNIADLDEERKRISELLRNRGYFYFRPDYMKYQADTTRVGNGQVSLRLIPIPGLPAAAQKPYYLGQTSFSLEGKNGEAANDSLWYKDLKIYYHDKLRVRPNMLYRWLNYQGYVRKSNTTADSRSRLYTQRQQERIQEKLNQLGIFKMIDLEYMPRDSAALCDTLDLKIRAALDKPLDAELSLSVTTKSNNQTGPGLSCGVTKHNVFGGGESWNVKLNGSYEWQTGGDGQNSLLNSWEVGSSSSLIFPRVVFPRFGDREYDFPATTTFKVYVNQLNRAKYYKFLSFGGNATYDFQPTRVSRHSVTPFRLTFNVLQSYTQAFADVANENPVLYISLQDQFIPAMEYTYTYDNSSRRSVKHPIWWQSTIVSAGNVTSCVYRLFGQRFDEQNKKLWKVPFAQFMKLNSELRYSRHIDKNNSLAARVGVGAIFAYGNSVVPPFNEQFYVGGANSIRAFTVRSIGPGGFHNEDSRISFWDETGTFRFEANLEYRFRLYKSFWGATFLDAGNVWLLRKDVNRPDSQLRMKTFAKQIALGTGLGLRYDMDILVFRFDVGVPLHYPYSTGRSGYYNATGGFFNHLGYHFAIGYPF